MKTGFAFLCFLFIGASPAAAQTCATPLTGTCSLSGLNLTISFTRAFSLALSSSATALTVPTAAHYNTGYAATNGPTVTISSNANWTLGINSSTTTWTAVTTGTEPARATKPSTDLQWSRAVGGPFGGMTTTAAAVQGGSAVAATVINLFYRTTYAWGLDTPGNYSIQIVFTLTAP